MFTSRTTSKWFWSGVKGSWKKTRQCEKSKGIINMLSQRQCCQNLLLKKISQYSQSTQLFATLGWQSPTHPKPEPLQSLHVIQLPSFHLHRDAKMRSHVPAVSKWDTGKDRGAALSPRCTQVPHPAEVTLRTTCSSQSSPHSAQPGIFAYPNHSFSTMTWNVQALRPRDAN